MPVFVDIEFGAAGGLKVAVTAGGPDEEMPFDELAATGLAE